MKLDKRLELLTALAMLAVGGDFEEDSTDDLIGRMIEGFELEDDSVPNLDSKTLLILIGIATTQIQDMIEEYEGFERDEDYNTEKETLH